MLGEKVLILASVASMIDQFNMPNIKLLIDMGYEVHVACNFIEGNTCSSEQIERLKGALESLGVDYYQIDFKRNVINVSNNIIAYKQVLNLMNQNKYGFAHCHSPIGGVIGRLAGKVTKTKIIYTAHGFHFFKGAPVKNWLIYYPIEKWLSKYTNILITINKEDYERAKRFKAKRLEYVPGVGIDIERFDAVKVDREKKRKELNIPQGAFIILSVGELNKNKNHEVVIRAVAEINNPKIHYVICGQGVLGEYLQDLSNELGIGNQVRLLGFRKDIAEICKVSDIFVFPSLREGLPVSLMEAMACGLPCAVSKIRGNVDLIDEGGGVLFDPTSIEECKTKIKQLLDTNRTAMKKYNRKKIKNYDIKTVVKQMQENIRRYI